jgi:hypothetical protein
MAPFRRGRSAQPEVDHPEDDTETTPRRDSAWEARRRRGKSKNTPTSNPTNTKNTRDKLPEDEYDPYDSDPGESYREHCDRIKGKGRSCLVIPKFLKQREYEDTVATAPPSPLASDVGEFNTPASLPRDLARVRYSLRTAVGDGTERQPDGPTVMERRDLRPNNVHINVSHWSDFGGRGYMEDR